MEDQASRMRSLLRRLHSDLNGIEASAAISGDGLSLASVLEPGMDADRFGALCASLLALSDTVAREVARGRFRQVLVEGDQGSLLVVQSGGQGVLAVAAGPRANLGHVFLAARKTADALACLF